jgi:hypothetical protein
MGPTEVGLGAGGAGTEGLRHTIINAECLINYLNRVTIPTMFYAFARVSSFRLFPAIAAAATVQLLFNKPAQCTGGHQMWNTSTLLRKQNTHFYKMSVFYEAQHDVHQALNDVIGKNPEMKKIVTMPGMEGRLKSGYRFTIPDDLKALVGAPIPNNVLIAIAQKFCKRVAPFTEVANESDGQIIFVFDNYCPAMSEIACNE